MEPEDLGPVPGVSDQEVREALNDLTHIPIAPADTAERFGIAVRAIVEDRAQKGWSAEGDFDVAVFVHTLYPRDVGAKFSAGPVSNLIANANPILGKLFLLNPDASYGRMMDLPVEADAVIDWLIDQALGDQPVVFAYRKSQQLLARRDGAKSEISRKDIIRQRPPAVTLGEIQDALTLIHRQYLLSPAVCPAGIWEKHRSSEYVPGVWPEKAIQREMQIGLGSWFHGIVRATVEETTSVGRIDVRLSYLRDGGWTYWAILELKVLRSSHHAAKGVKANPVSLSDNLEAVAEGIRQVNAFAKVWQAEPLLEIFDLRKLKEPNVLMDKKIIQELSKYIPTTACRVWPIFGSAGDARLAAFPLS